eukprot:Nk52_evm8s2612 gene=Nk52_evmTU8s2612
MTDFMFPPSVYEEERRLEKEEGCVEGLNQELEKCLGVFEKKRIEFLELSNESQRHLDAAEAEKKRLQELEAAKQDIVREGLEKMEETLRLNEAEKERKLKKQLEELEDEIKRQGEKEVEDFRRVMLKEIEEVKRENEQLRKLLEKGGEGVVAEKGKVELGDFSGKEAERKAKGRAAKVPQQMRKAAAQERAKQKKEEEAKQKKEEEAKQKKEEEAKQKKEEEAKQKKEEEAKQKKEEEAKQKKEEEANKKREEEDKGKVEEKESEKDVATLPSKGSKRGRGAPKRGKVVSEKAQECEYGHDNESNVEVPPPSATASMFITIDNTNNKTSEKSVAKERKKRKSSCAPAPAKEGKGRGGGRKKQKAAEAPVESEIKEGAPELETESEPVPQVQKKKRLFTTKTTLASPAKKKKDDMGKAVSEKTENPTENGLEKKENVTLCEGPSVNFDTLSSTIQPHKGPLRSAGVNIQNSSIQNTKKPTGNGMFRGKSTSSAKCIDLRKFNPGGLKLKPNLKFQFKKSSK